MKQLHFKLQKKHNTAFELLNSCTLKVEELKENIESNISKVQSIIFIPKVDSLDCSTPYWRA